MQSGRTAVLHIGTRKSGTTYVQSSLIRSADALAAQHAGLNLTTRHRVGVLPGLVRDQPEDQSLKLLAMERIVDALDAGLERPIVSLEALAEQPDHAIEHLVSRLDKAGYAAEIIITARHWGKAIPSEWQQTIKQRGTIAYADFVEQIRRGSSSAEAERFVMRQHVPGIVRRWSKHVPLERIHVVVCPATPIPKRRLLNLFCQAAGLDPAPLRVPNRAVNTSLSLAQAEMLRLLNVRLEGRLPRNSKTYLEQVRRGYARSMARQEQPSVRLAEGYAKWCAEESRRQLDELLSLGVDIVGSKEELLCSPKLETGPVQADLAGVLDAAIGLLADRVTEGETSTTDESDEDE